MGDLELLENMDGICEELLKNIGHSFGIDFARLNETLIEIHARIRELQAEAKKDDKQNAKVDGCIEDQALNS